MASTSASTGKRKEEAESVNGDDEFTAPILSHSALVKIMQGQVRIRDAFAALLDGQSMIVDAMSSVLAVKAQEPEEESVVPVPSKDELSKMIAASIAANAPSTSHPRRKRVKYEGPKKISGYILFCEEERAKEVGSDEKLNVTILGGKWTALSEADKAAYQERAKKRNEEYKHEYEIAHAQTDQVVAEPTPVHSADHSPPSKSVKDIQSTPAPAPVQAASTSATTAVNNSADADAEAEKKKKKKKNKDKKAKVSTEVPPSPIL